jgi:glycosyltransferase involved in cell wall biosynthesis
MKKIKVYFHQFKMHRDVQKDVLRGASRCVEVITQLSDRKGIDNVAVFNSRPNRAVIFLRDFLLATIPMVNLRLVDKIHESADLVYTWNMIPLNSKRPFIVETENAYAISFYRSFGMKILKPIVKMMLRSKRCHRIVCMSDACRLSLLSEIGDEFEEKTRVLYPYIERNYSKNSGDNKKVNFLFVGFAFELKGGKELLKAFHETPDKNITLTVVGQIPEKYVKQYSSDSRIRFLGQQKREILLSKIFPASDILIFPSFYESFGVVALEGIASGLGIIATDIYALPELVEHGKNGYLIDHPIIAPSDYKGRKVVDPTRMTMIEFEKKFLRDKGMNEKLYQGLKVAIAEGIENNETWKAASRSLFERKFSPERWQEDFMKIIQK